MSRDVVRTAHQNHNLGATALQSVSVHRGSCAPGSLCANGHMHIRPATSADTGTVLRFIHELAEYEREPDAVRTTHEHLSAALFGERPFVFSHVAEHAGEVVGMAVWFLNFSTWEGTHGIYVEDLYVTPVARGLGAGRALLRCLAQECLHRGYARLELSVLDWNEPAIGFYRTLGATAMTEWTVQRITGPALADLADS